MLTVSWRRRFRHLTIPDSHICYCSFVSLQSVLAKISSGKKQKCFASQFVNFLPHIANEAKSVINEISKKEF